MMDGNTVAIIVASVLAGALATIVVYLLVRRFNPATTHVVDTGPIEAARAKAAQEQAARAAAHEQAEAAASIEQALHKAALEAELEKTKQQDATARANAWLAAHGGKTEPKP